MLTLLKEIFTWWNQQTLGTRLQIFFFGNLVGKDHLGNKYVVKNISSEKLYNQLNCLLFLKANNFKLLQQWRIKQEKKLWLKNNKSSNNKLMNKKDIIQFMQTYQRITQNMFKYAPKYASIILNLNSNHQIKSIVYKKK